ncbi:uncharacterized protein K441DRAFT_263781 [Cenococcum geophilum 1.58]|uniref:uncharacterized protein n=1 Tax=Cenococcum geophilum 1.58 TaxID=794803 RepID=UPI00358E0B06|nr:hypothetical protein K441DRAFT_263781 [Cenococcum geophilum 1.58]
MKPQSAAPKLFVAAIEMVRDDPQRFDQSWIPPGQTAPSEGKYGTTQLEPWLHEYAYIYSSTSQYFTDEVPLKESSHRHELDQRHALGQHDKPDIRPERLDRITTINKASNIGVRSEGPPYNDAAIEGIPRQSAPHSPSDLPPKAIIGPQRPPEPPPRFPEFPQRPSEPPPPPRFPEPPPRSPEPPPRPPKSPPKRQHSGSSELGSNSTIPGSTYANSRVQDNRKPKRKKRFMGWMRGKRKDERHDGMNEPRDANNHPHGCRDGCDTSTSPHEPGQPYDAHYRHDSKETLRPLEPAPRQPTPTFFSKVKTSFAHSRSGNQTSGENGRDSNAGRDSRSTTKSLSSKLKQHVVGPLARLTRHGSKDTHRPLPDSSPLPSSHTTDVPTQHCLASRSSTLERSTPSSTSTLCSPTAYEKHNNFGLNVRVIPRGPPRPFQCTFCLEQCENRSDWMEHERSHFPKQGWTCMINSQDRIEYDGRILCDFCGIVDKSHNFSQHNIDACVNSRLENRTFATESDMTHHLATVHNHDNTMIEEWPKCMDSWFWSCGFCDSVLLSWDERQSHIADEHFENMCTMALWNPLTSPYPWSKQSSTLVRGFPRWEQSTLLAAIRQPTILDFINRVGETRLRNQCRLCKIAFSTFDDLSQHMTQWHGHPRSWSCPKGSTFKDFFEPDSSYTDNSAVADNDICLYCGKKFSNPPNWSLRKRHLEEEHHFNECAHEKFFKQDQFCRHLANSHNVDIEYMKDFISSCWREDDRTPATGLVGR